MSKISNYITEYKDYLTRVLITLAVIIFAISGWFWWQKVYQNPYRVFWGMIDSSLSSGSVTKRVKQEAEGVTLDQLVQLHIGMQHISRGLEISNHSGEGQAARIVQETIATPKADYSRYVSINSAKDTDYSSVLGVWGKNEEQVQYFNQATLGTIPFASFNQQTRREIIEFMKSKGTFMPSYNVSKKEVNGREVYEYEVKINPVAYFETLQLYIKKLGTGEVEGLDPSAYEGVEPLSTKFYIEPVTRKIVKIEYQGSSQAENYESHGLRQAPKEPTESINIDELQERIQELQ